MSDIQWKSSLEIPEFSFLHFQIFKSWILNDYVPNVFWVFTFFFSACMQIKNPFLSRFYRPDSWMLYRKRICNEMTGMIESLILKKKKRKKRRLGSQMKYLKRTKEQKQIKMKRGMTWKKKGKISRQ